MPLDTRQRNLPISLNPQACFEDIAARSVHPELGKRFSLSDMRSWCAAASATPHGVLESSQKRLMIFDQSGNQTRLLTCPFPLRFPSPEAAEPVKLSELQQGLEGNGVKEFEENYINGKESEMHEDTEEINALLYSDDDDDEECESDDEVMSTGHSPYQVCNNKRQLDEAPDGPCKRQKLLDKVDSSSLNGSYFLMDKNISESTISTKEDTGSGLSNEQSRKDKIHTALKILESIVPGAKGNEALLLLDEAIDYLKLLKQDLISTVTSHHNMGNKISKQTDKA